jgi:hypothetical protein
MTRYLWTALGLITGLALAALAGMASQEIRDRLEHLPYAILRLATRRLTPGQRTTIYQDEWLPELTYILRETETRPVTRLITGTRYSLGIFRTVGRVSRTFDRPDPRPEAHSAQMDVIAIVFSTIILLTPMIIIFVLIGSGVLGHSACNGYYAYARVSRCVGLVWK